MGSRLSRSNFSTLVSPRVRGPSFYTLFWLYSSTRHLWSWSHVLQFAFAVCLVIHRGMPMPLLACKYLPSPPVWHPIISDDTLYSPKMPVRQPCSHSPLGGNRCVRVIISPSCRVTQAGVSSLGSQDQDAAHVLHDLRHAISPLHHQGKKKQARPPLNDCQLPTALLPQTPDSPATLFFHHPQSRR